MGKASSVAPASLTPGTRLGRYEIVEFLAAGGMGQVYRARDLSLARDVALKLLPEHLATDATRRIRFDREARLVAALNHPNIVTIHSIEQVGDRMFLTMELVQGQPLSHLIPRSGLPLNRLLALALPIADAVAAAHERGITHRDLKPANVLVNDNATIKVLDFGVAKRHDVDAASDLTSTVTLDSVTADGHIVGTVAYMSPEQAEGKSADARSDVFALGTMLYEMATGRRPFGGNTSIAVLAAIVRDTPTPVTEVNPHLPRELGRVIRRAMAKEPDWRQQSAKDLRNELDDIRRELESGELRAGVLPVSVRSRLSIVALASALVLAGVGAGFVLRSTPGESSVGPRSWRQLTFRQGYVHDARLAGDSQTVVYAATWDGLPFQIYSTTTVSPESRATDLPSAGLFGVSPTGQLALSLSCRYASAFGTCRGTLARAPLAGGAPRELANDVVAADWGTGDDLAVIRDDQGQSVLEFPIGTRVSLNAQAHVRVWSGGRRLAWIELGKLMVRDEAGTRALGPPWRFVSALAWASEGNAIYVSGLRPGDIGDDFVRRLWLDGRDEIVLRSGSRLRLLDTDRTGRWLVDQGASDLSIAIRATHRPDAPSRELSWLGHSVADALSADGKTLLFTERGPSPAGPYVIYARPTDGGPAVRLGNGYGQAISDDSRWALTTTRPDRGSDALVLYPLGPGNPKTLEGGGLELGASPAYPADFVDASRVIFRARQGTEPWRTYVQPVAGGPPVLVSHEPGFITAPMSPDGARFVSRRADGSVWIASVMPGDAVRVPAKITDDQMVVEWTNDGKGLLIATRQTGLASITRLDLATGKETKVADVRPQSPAGFNGFFGRGLFMTPDGETLVVTESRIRSDLFLVGDAR